MKIFLNIFFLMLMMNTFQFSYAQTLPQFSQEKHQGVASCASSNCHGRVTESENSVVLLNEYRTWLMHDKHAQAYKVLNSKASWNIAKKMGIGNPQKSKVCLDCHTDNTAPNKRGEKFQLSDGVGCEACHGGAEKWIATHTSPKTNHMQNISNGMYPLDQPEAMGKLCLSCHQGTNNKQATHEVMGAGHPRLRFDLQVYTQNQPAHFKIDEDYTKRGKQINGAVELWLGGLLESANNSLILLAANMKKSKQYFLEPSILDCHSCHTPMSSLSWVKGRYGLPSGSMRFNLAYIELLSDVVTALNWQHAQTYNNSLKKLHKSIVHSSLNTQNHIQKIKNLNKTLRRYIDNSALSDDQYKRIQKALVLHSSRGHYRSFIQAEMAFLAIDTIHKAIGESALQTQFLDRLFGAIKSEKKYNARVFQVISGEFFLKLK